MSHTKGPWTITKTRSPSWDIDGPSRMRHGFSFETPIAKVWRREDLFVGGEPEALANARLVAAAPDMLEALIYAKRYHAAMPCNIQGLIADAIKKATGAE